MSSAVPALPPSTPAPSAWSRSAQLAATLLLGVGGTLLAVKLVGAPARPLELREPPLDINRADKAELLQLPGVGPNLANQIAAVRDDRGGFNSPEELKAVPGMGPARLERIRPWVRTEGGQPPPSPKAAAPSQLIDLNRATAAELEKLPGIGPKIAQRIVDERAKAPFKSIDDLRRVNGIGAKTLEKLRTLVMVKSDTTP